MLALYGHPDAGGYWEKHCEKHLLSVGFTPVSEWRSCFWHAVLKLCLVVYVDDFKLSGPENNLAKGWALLRKTLIIDKETGHGEYLGCGHEPGSFKMPDGSLATSVSYNMESVWDSCLQIYM